MSSLYDSQPNPVLFVRCKNCSSTFPSPKNAGISTSSSSGSPQRSSARGYFIFKDDSLRVMAGPPDPLMEPYTAVSHMWGDDPSELIRCLHCHSQHKVLALGATKVARCIAGQAIMQHKTMPMWFDVMSIDQEDNTDVSAQVSIMGNIFSSATHVNVVLDEPDYERFFALHKAVKSLQESDLSIARALAQREERLVGKVTDVELMVKFLRIPMLVKLVIEANYMKRAWTFQEWCLARDVTLFCETRLPIRDYKSSMAPLRDIRLALRALTYERGVPLNLYDELSGAALLMSRFEDILTHTPLRDRILSLLAQRESASLSSSRGSGSPIRSMPRGPLNLADSRELARNDGYDLTGALDDAAALYSTADRHARFRADAVAAWVSMLSISFQYNRDDSPATLYQKIAVAMRNVAESASYPYAPQLVQPVNRLNAQPVTGALGLGLGVAFPDVTHFGYTASPDKSSIRLMDALRYFVKLNILGKSIGLNMDGTVHSPTVSDPDLLHAFHLRTPTTQPRLLITVNLFQDCPGVLVDRGPRSPRIAQAVRKLSPELERYTLTARTAYNLRVNDYQRAQRAFNVSCACNYLTGHLLHFEASSIRVGYTINSLAQYIYEAKAPVGIIILTLLDDRKDGDVYVVFVSDPSLLEGADSAGQVEAVSVYLLASDNRPILIRTRDGMYLGRCLRLETNPAAPPTVSWSSYNAYA
ncbi:hypothetical protein BJ742DRAFT_794533 [Cladochytrium replicatum]|nr:hypothetical protein BJ742DRAFT_794533 [Cladochytrium replicatum]